MPGPGLDDDDALVAALTEALEEGREVPDTFVRAGDELFTLRDLDVELAELVSDSAQRPLAASATRADGPEHASIRDVTFESRLIVVVLQILGRGAQGQVVEVAGGDEAGVSGTVEIRSEEALPVVATISEQGWFSFAAIPRGRIRLLCRTAAGAAVLTSAITV